MLTTTNKHISLPMQFSEGEPMAKYKICCDANDWDNDTKVKKQLMLLEDYALMVH